MESQSDVVKIKSEAAGKPKPKFTPKAPPKKEIVEPVAAPAPAPSDFRKGRDGPGSRKGGRDGDKGGRLEGRGRDGRGRDGRGRDGRGAGRGRWVMPTGLAFFTGNASALTQNKTMYVIGGSGPVTSALKEEEELIKADGSVGIKSPGSSSHNHSSSGKSGIIQNVLHAPTREIDSDSEDDMNVENRELQEGEVEEDESWPPLEGRYDPLAPLSLPFGPKTAKERHRVANAPILADPRDFMGMEEEESRNIFLLQLPSQLKPKKTAAVELPNSVRPIDDASDKSTKIKKGSKIGKMQLSRSGKVVLILTDGRKFEVNSGMYASFAQYVGAVVLDEDAIAKSLEDSAANAAAALQNKKPAKKIPVAVVNKNDMSASEPFLGKLLVMGNVTKKLVITPDFPIGTPRNIGIRDEEEAGNEESGMEIGGYDDWVNNSSANAGASASADAESVNVKTVNFAAEIEVETTNVSSSKLIVKQERIISKVLPAKIVPKGKKGVITIKDEPGDSKAKSVETSSSISSNSNSSNYHESSDNRTENHDQSYYDVEEEYEGGHLNEDEVDD